MKTMKRVPRSKAISGKTQQLAVYGLMLLMALVVFGSMQAFFGV